jgi:hypothetical protein
MKSMRSKMSKSQSKKPSSDNVKDYLYRGGSPGLSGTGDFLLKTNKDVRAYKKLGIPIRRIRKGTGLKGLIHNYEEKYNPRTKKWEPSKWYDPS